MLLRLLLIITLGLSTAFAADSPRYTDNLDGTVTDTTTGAMWKRCSEGQTWTGVTCSGSAATYTWEQAKAQASTSTFAGYDDWRVPNIRELHTITDLTISYPAIDESAFPNTDSASFWSGSPVAGGSDGAWGVGFEGGVDGWGYRTSALAVRLLRAGTVNLLFDSLMNESRPTEDYIDNGNGTVTHTPTCLMWKRCAEGQQWNGSTCTGNASSYSFSSAISLTSNFANYTDWRLPMQHELLSLVDYFIAYPGPTINTTLFPNTNSKTFWSGSPVAGDSGYAWDVYFDDGGAYWDDRTSALAVRLLRAGQCFAIWPLTVLSAGSGSGQIISNPSGINCGDGNNNCTASYQSGTKVTLTAIADSGSNFAGWSNSCSKDNNTCTLEITEAKSISAIFNSNSRSLIVIKKGNGKGKVTSNPSGIDCGMTCSHNYPKNTFVTLTATPVKGAKFIGWSGACAGLGTCTVKMTTGTMVNAYFEKRR